MRREYIEDELTQRIRQRLGERQQKIRRMEEFRRPTPKKVFLYRAMTMSAIACVALLFVINPWKHESVLEKFGAVPNLTEFRSASPGIAEIQRMMEVSDYEAALKMTAEVLKHSDLIKDSLDAVDIGNDEELMYELQLERTVNSELRWTYIYLLLKAERNDDAQRELEVYLKEKDYCSHATEAESILKIIK